MTRSAGHPKGRRVVAMLVSLSLALLAAAATATSVSARQTSPSRPDGPCDIYAAGGTPCVAAHSTTRALYEDYDGPLYRVRRLSDNTTRDIGVTQPSTTPAPDGGGYADAKAQDRFCADTTCLITVIYDQSPQHNDLTQAPRGNFHGPAMGGANNLPIAGSAPVTVDGHKVYGTYIEPGMGLRNNDTNGVAVDDEAEGMYWVVDGQHYNDGCCFDYGNTEIDSHDDGNGTMETSYFGNSTGWYRGQGPGPWVMTDQENNLVGCVNPGSDSKYCPTVPTVDNRFETAVAKGEPHHWASLGGNAQNGSLTSFYDGQRIDSSYNPMRKQGGIVLGNGGDNSVGSAGTFYEGVLTRGYPTDATDADVQANIVQASYDVASLSLAPSDQTDTPPGVQTFAPGESQDVTESYINTTGATAVGVTLGLQLPAGWTASVSRTGYHPRTFASVAPGATVRTTFTVTAGATSFDGDLVGKASWTDPLHSPRTSVTAREHVRDTSPVTINEFRVATSDDPTDSYVELNNAASHAVNVSGWTLTEHATEQPANSTITVPPNTVIATHGHYVLGLSDSGLSAPAKAGDRTVYLRSTTGLSPGDKIRIGDGSSAEPRRIASVNATGATGPRVQGKIGQAVKLSGNGEYASLPTGIVSHLSDFTVSAWVNPSADSTWSRVFDFGTGTSTNMFLTVDGGGAGLRFAITTGGNGIEEQLTGGGQLPLNTWSHVTVTHSGSTGVLYLNGAAVATDTTMTLTPADLGDTTQNYIGKSQYADPYLDATVDDFQIYDHALTADEVGALSGGQPGAGNVASYSFDEAGGPKALDSSGQGNDATIISDTSSAGAGTPLFQPLPDGPIITVPSGSTNVPVTSTSGFEVGQRVSIGYGDTIETAEVTDVGQPGTQALLSAPAPAGSTTLKVNTTATISVGDTIRLDIASRKETVHVTAVGTPGADGTGLTLDAPLQHTHSSNLPFADRGTGITFTPATSFDHSSNEPVKPLGNGVTLTRALGREHDVDAAVVDHTAAGAGYQGAPDQWFGGPALSSGAGSMVLHDAHGSTADSLNYGLLVDPWLQEGYQGASGAGAAGCFVAAPGTDRSAARYPDGADSDTNCVDFLTTPDPTPGTANRTVALDSGPRVSIRAAGSTSSFIRHDDFDDAVVTSTVTASSSGRVKQDATFVEAPGLADPSCVSFESVNRPGSYLRHFDFIVHLQPNDGSSAFGQDATFCPKDGKFQSVNFPAKYLRAYRGGVYVAGDGGDNAWDATADYAQDTSWLQNPPWAAS